MLVNNSLLNYDEIWMTRALFLATKSMHYNEVPVGAVLVFNNMELCSSFNFTFKFNNLLGHAEMNVINICSKNLSVYRLYNTTLYVTLEPCIMCFGAILRYRIKRVVFGAFSNDFFSMTKVLNLKKKKPIIFLGGVLEKKSSNLLYFFFSKKR